MCAGVYKIQNIVSRDIYIGSTKVFKRRFREHNKELKLGKHVNAHLQNAWDKYGKQSFVFSIVIVCEVALTRFYEQLIMDRYTPAYNKSKSAYSGIVAGSTCTQEHKEKVGRASKKLWGNTEYREKVTDAIRNSMTFDECSKRSERTKKLWADPQYRSNAIAARVGRVTNKGYKCTAEQVENRRRAGRISNMRRVHGHGWEKEYIARYPEHIGDVNA